jgi:hypothetical protein
VYAVLPPGTGAAAPLGISRAVRCIFDGPSDLATDPDHAALLRVYLTDLLRPYGITTVKEGHGQSYAQMAERVVDLAVPPDQPLDLIVLAFAIPDIHPGRAVATYLSQLRPGHRLAFAVTDQGSAAAFTGLRLIREYTHGGGCRQALLVVVEQADLPYPPTAPATVPAAHAAVGLFCTGSDGRARLAEVRQRPDADIADAKADVAACATERLIVSGSLGAIDGARVAPEGQPGTGVWWALADELATPGRVVLADYDPALRYLSLAAVDVAG